MPTGSHGPLRACTGATRPRALTWQRGSGGVRACPGLPAAVAPIHAPTQTAAWYYRSNPTQHDSTHHLRLDCSQLLASGL